MLPHSGQKLGSPPKQDMSVQRGVLGDQTAAVSLAPVLTAAWTTVRTVRCTVMCVSSLCTPACLSLLGLTPVCTELETC